MRWKWRCSGRNAGDVYSMKLIEVVADAGHLDTLIGLAEQATEMIYMTRGCRKNWRVSSLFTDKFSADFPTYLCNRLINKVYK